jgi:hypothetical protein
MFSWPPALDRVPIPTFSWLLALDRVPILMCSPALAPVQTPTCSWPSDYLQSAFLGFSDQIQASSGAAGFSLLGTVR